MYPSLSAAIGTEVTPDTTVDELLALAEKVGLEVPKDKATATASSSRNCGNTSAAISCTCDVRP